MRARVRVSESVCEGVGTWVDECIVYAHSTRPFKQSPLTVLMRLCLNHCLDLNQCLDLNHSTRPFKQCPVTVLTLCVYRGKGLTGRLWQSVGTEERAGVFDVCPKQKKIDVYEYECVD